MQIEKVYEPQRFEPHWAQWWVDCGFFTADSGSTKPAFSIAIPPPNVTGNPHTITEILKITYNNFSIESTKTFQWKIPSYYYCTAPHLGVFWGRVLLSRTQLEDLKNEEVRYSFMHLLDFTNLAGWRRDFYLPSSA
jgi:hypothetical protein